MPTIISSINRGFPLYLQDFSVQASGERTFTFTSMQAKALKFESPDHIHCHFAIQSICGAGINVQPENIPPEQC